MAYTYVNKKTGEAIQLNGRAKSDFWEERLPEEEPEQEEPEQQEETPAEAPKKNSRSRGKK